MNIEIGNIIKSKLEQFQVGGSGTNQFIDKLSGVVSVISMTERNETDSHIIKTFPIACDTSFEDCTKSGSYKDLIPNSKYGCMIYLEENGGVDLQSEDRNGRKYKTSFLLVGWVNQKKLGTDQCSVTGKIVSTIINALTIKPFNQDIYTSIQIEVSGQNPKSQNPFTKYTYDQDATQYLMKPFDYFSLNLEVNFVVNPTCITPFEKQSSTNCN